MKGKKPLSGEYLTQLMKKIPIPRNQIAARSGLSNPYIRNLENGKSTSASRKKLISLGVALNLNLNGIDELLTAFERSKMTVDDIPIFINTAKRWKSSSALHPLRNVYSIELAFLSNEQIPGDTIIINDRPTACLRAQGHRTFTDKRLVRSHPIYSELIEAIGRERKHNFTKQLEQFPFECYMNQDSLERYLKDCPNAAEKAWRVKHVDNMRAYVLKYPNFRIFLVKSFPSFIYMLKLPLDPKIPTKLNFLGKQLDFFIGPRSGQLAGFITDNQIIVDNFLLELKFMKKSIIEKYRNPSKLNAYLDELIHI